jgi:flagellar basal-body rod modification protein FlgD
MTTPVGGTDATSTSVSTTTTTTGGTLDKNAFLKLLVASMKYQDPSKPVDSAAYMAQLAQFAQVEKLDAISTAQADASRWQQTVAGQGMLGRTVTGKGATGGDLTGVVTGVQLTAAGSPRLQLSTGGTLAVTEVTQVAPTPTIPAA